MVDRRRTKEAKNFVEAKLSLLVKEVDAKCGVPTDGMSIAEESGYFHYVTMETVDGIRKLIGCQNASRQRSIVG